MKEIRIIMKIFIENLKILKIKFISGKTHRRSKSYGSPNLMNIINQKNTGN